jgi:hypothetical protein
VLLFGEWDRGDRLRRVADGDGLPAENIAIPKDRNILDGRPSVSVCQESSALSTAGDEEQEWDISSLVEMLETVPDPRSTRGRIYRLSFILGVSLVAMLAGAASFSSDS